MKEEGVSEVLSVVLIFAVATIAFSLYYLTYISSSTRANETKHMSEVIDRFGLLLDLENLEIPMAPEPVRFLVFTVPPRIGRLVVENSGMGTIEYSVDYSELKDFSVVFQNGAVFTFHHGTWLMRNPPVLFSVTDGQVQTVEYHVEDSWAVSTSRSIRLRLRARVEEETLDGLNYVISSDPRIAHVWRQYLEIEAGKLGRYFDGVVLDREKLELRIENVRWFRRKVRLKVSFGL